jgi:hypothetical protein
MQGLFDLIPMFSLVPVPVTGKLERCLGTHDRRVVATAADSEQGTLQPD